MQPSQFQPTLRGYTVDGIGHFSLRPFSLHKDMSQLYSWVSQPYAYFWGMQDMTLEEATEQYRQLQSCSQIYIGELQSKAVFLLEVYDPKTDPLGEYYEVQPGDFGMHILVANAQSPIHGFTWAVFQVAMRFIFSALQAKRIVVEPDSRNQKIQALNARAGFVFDRLINLEHKTARLEFCTRQQFFHALLKDSYLMLHHQNSAALEKPSEVIAHLLNPDIWKKVNRLLVRKALSEFAHERLISPTLSAHASDGNEYEVYADDPSLCYRFRAKLLALNHWVIDEHSIEKCDGKNKYPVDAVTFIGEFREQLNLAQDLLPTYIEEICSTLYGSAFKHQRPNLDVGHLVDADFQTLERAMMEGHPCFIANNGRIGFDSRDYRAFSPETGEPVRLIWLAVRKSQTIFASSQGVNYQTLIEQELSEQTRQEFISTLSQLTDDVNDYYFLPVHPWQWYQKLAFIFSADIATRNIICLGYSEDHYKAQQSIRTFFNTSSPEKNYVKTALSILNMGFMRGLSPDYMSHTPAINDWIYHLIEQDPYLDETGFSILREVASMGYRNTRFENVTAKSSGYRKMLSTLWRESPVVQLNEGESLMSMAGLLHIDAQGEALLPALINASGMDTDAWLRSYLHSYLTPLVHCFYCHDLVFMPHGENIILVMKEHVPVRAIMKDIAEECAIMNADIVLSESIQRLSVDVPEDLKILSLFTDIFDCFFRFMSAILEEQHEYSQSMFWALVAECIQNYQDSHPELVEKFQRYDLFADEFTLSCLNRLQLSNNQQMVDLQDPAKNLKFAGTLKNPIAKYRITTNSSEAVVSSLD